MQNNVEIFSVSEFDILDYIESLEEPQKSICHALIINGECTKSVAGRFHVTQKTILRRARKALVPLAVQYGISNVVKYLPHTRQAKQVD